MGVGKMAKNNKKKRLGHMFKDVLDVPEEVALDLPKVTLIGNSRLDIENHQGIIHYDKTEMKLKVNQGYLVAKGKQLILRNISQEEVMIEGEILQIGIILDADGGNDNTVVNWEDIYDFNLLEAEEEKEQNDDFSGDLMNQPKEKETNETEEIKLAEELPRKIE